MKLILSRKGFDSSIGGCASPILPDGAMLSLPIPLASAPIRFDDIVWRGRPLGPVVERLSRGRVRASDPAHLDPDLVRARRPRPPGWRPAFGQVAAAQSHLAAAGVGPGDLFLFFGWFRGTDADMTRFRPDAPDQHVLFGWLQVGAVLPVGADLAAARARFPALADHPHLRAHAVPSNTVYLAADRLVLDGIDRGVGGAGTFGRFHPGLRLTAEGAATRSEWRLPGWLHPNRGAPLSYHLDPARWRDEGATCRLRSVSQGQEFVTTASPARVAEWMTSFLAGCHTASDLETELRT